MGLLLRQLVGGAFGLGLGWLLLFYIPDRRHAKRCVRQLEQTMLQFNQRVSELDRRMKRESRQSTPPSSSTDT
jgi:hypothetical protein